MARIAKSSGSWSNKDISRAIADDYRFNPQLAGQIYSRAAYVVLTFPAAMKIRVLNA